MLETRLYLLLESNCLASFAPSGGFVTKISRISEPRATEVACGGVYMAAAGKRAFAGSGPRSGRATG